MNVPTRLIITYGDYTAPESVAAVMRSLRSHLERDECPDDIDPFGTEEGREEAVLLRAQLDRRIAAAEPDRRVRRR